MERLDSGGSPDSFPLEAPGPVVIGRSRGCAVRIDDAKTSRRHCVFEFHDDRWHVKDLGSTNGTQVNDRTVQTAALADGDVVTVGRVSLVFRNGQPRGSNAGRVATTVNFVSPSRASDRERDLNANDWVTSELPVVPSGQSPGSPRTDLLGGRYELGPLLHQGSTGSFFKARDTKSDRVVCVKMLSTRVTENEADLRRFVRGVQTAGKLHHPNIVQLFRAGHSRSRKQWWLAMEYVDGPSLRQIVAKYGIGKMLAPDKVLAIARDIVAALAVAFERQVLHRNIRPENILLTKSGTAKLADFALVRGVVLTTLQRVTGSSELVGDLAYMAPERTELDGVVDCRSDIYALGACMYTLLAGQPPFTGRGTVDLIDKVRHSDPTPLTRRNLSVPGPLEGVVMKCLAKSPTDRFQTPQELSDELGRVARFHGFSR